MKQYLQSGAKVNLTAPAGGVVGGQGVQVGSIFGYVSADTAAGDTMVVNVHGIFGPVTTDTGAAWAEGDVLYWDNTNSRLTKTASTNLKVGACAAAKLAGDVISTVYLPGIIG